MISKTPSGGSSPPGDLVCFFRNPTADLRSEVQLRREPEERLYGFPQLERLGWRVRYSDERWRGSLAGLRAASKRYIELPSYGAFRHMRQSDIAIVKDDFALCHLANARLAGCKLVYLDSMFRLPRSFRLRWSAGLNLRFADLVIAFSRSQATEWEVAFRLPPGRLSAVTYCMDLDFYPQLPRDPQIPPYVLSIGRDLGRDFRTLLEAAEAAEMQVKLVTLPYLIPEEALTNPRVQILQRIPYDHLFTLYARASAAVVPLHAGVTYPSGIRAAMEGVLLGVPVIGTETPALEEYFRHDDHVRYVAPGDVGALTRELVRVQEQPAEAVARSQAAADYARRAFPLERMGRELDSAIRGLFEEP